jgi:hypothetical protein
MLGEGEARLRHVHRGAGLREGQFRLPFIESCQHITRFHHGTSLHTGLDDFSHRVRGHHGIALGRELTGDTQKTRKGTFSGLHGGPFHDHRRYFRLFRLRSRCRSFVASHQRKRGSG